MDSGNAIFGDAELGARAFTLAAEIRDQCTMADVAAAVHAAIAPLGMTAAASGMVSGPKAASPNTFHFANWPDDLITEYGAEGYLLIDPIPRWARSSGVAVTWSDVVERLGARDPGHRVMAAAARYGFTEGMVVPMRSADNSLGLISFGGQSAALSRPRQSFLVLVGRAAFEAAELIEQNAEIGRAAPILSAREIECIACMVRGHSDRQIGQLLGISERTARFHLDNARDKSGAVSRTHLAALAVAQGFVTV
jgi:DNA-binding CsgD family transcriptional regulator